MKDNRIVSFLTNNYKLIIPISLLLVVFITSIVYLSLSLSNKTTETTEKVFQYYYGKKYEYDLTISKDRKNVIKELKPQTKEITLDETPIYYQKKDIIIFPKDMSVIMPTLNCQEYLSPSYSYITYQKGIYNLTTIKYNKKLNHYFLYDGRDLYFFIEPITLTIGDEEIKLNSMSYIIAKYKNYISYYDKKTDVFKTIKTTNMDDYIENEYYKLYINRDTLEYQGSNVILTPNIETLNTIDKKD